MDQKHPKADVFIKLFEEFRNKCLEHNIAPVAVIRQSPFDIKADFDFVEVTKEQKKELTKKLVL